MSDDTRGSASEMRRSDLAGADLDNYYIEKKRYAIYFYLNVLYSINKLLEDVWAKAVISFLCCSLHPSLFQSRAYSILLMSLNSRVTWVAVSTLPDIIIRTNLHLSVDLSLAGRPP